MTEKRKTGTREWATSNLNIADGCSHGCRYCYARQAAVVRFAKRSGKTLENWTDVVVDPARVNRRYGKREGNIMFPTTHDILPEIVDECSRVLQRVLRVGNRVLLVTKPHGECVTRLCGDLARWREQVLWRFTIGADSDKVLRFWEPGAPPFEERLRCLRYAFDGGWATSVSVEPMLDPRNVERLVNRLDPWVTDKIWLGKLNQMKARCVDVPPRVLAALGKHYTDKAIMALVGRLGGNPKVEWKDSIKEVIERNT